MMSVFGEHFIKRLPHSVYCELVILVPIAYTVVSLAIFQDATHHNILEQGTRYNIKNDAILGACAIPGGIGEMSKQLTLFTCSFSFLMLVIQSAHLSQGGFQTTL